MPTDRIAAAADLAAQQAACEFWTPRRVTAAAESIDLELQHLQSRAFALGLSIEELLELEDEEGAWPR